MCNSWGRGVNLGVKKRICLEFITCVLTIYVLKSYILVFVHWGLMLIYLTGLLEGSHEDDFCEVLWTPKHILSLLLLFLLLGLILQSDFCAIFLCLSAAGREWVKGSDVLPFSCQSLTIKFYKRLLRIVPCWEFHCFPMSYRGRMWFLLTLLQADISATLVIRV